MSEVVRRLHEVIAALDRRAPRDGHHTEDAIARDAAALRERAVDHLAEIAGHTGPAGSTRS